MQFTQATTEMQQKIIDTITAKEYLGSGCDYDLSDDEGIFINAVDKMGFIRPVKRYIYGALASNEIDYKKESEALHFLKIYNSSDSQVDYAFIEGEYNLNKLIEKVGSKRLINDLRFIHKKAWNRCWEIDFYINKDGFIIERKNAGRFDEDTNILDFISELGCFQEKRKIKSKIVDRVIEALSSVNGKGYNKASKNIVEQAFYDFEYNLKKELHADIEAKEEANKEYWQEEVLKPQLENAIIDGNSVIYQKKWTEREVFNSIEDILCYFAMEKTNCRTFATTQKPLPENMDFQVFYELRNGNFICEGIWNPDYEATKYLHYNKELQRVEHYINGVLQYHNILDIEFIRKKGFIFENNKYVKTIQTVVEKSFYIN